MINVGFSLLGIPPSKKNAIVVGYKNKKRRRIYAGPSSDYQKWEKQAVINLKSQMTNTIRRLVPFAKCSLKIIFMVKSRRLWDLSNKTESIMDALVKSRIIENDHRFCVYDYSVNWKYGERECVIINLLGDSELCEP